MNSVQTMPSVSRPPLPRRPPTTSATRDRRTANTIDLGPGHRLLLLARPPGAEPRRTVRFVQLRVRGADRQHRVPAHRHDAYEVLLPRRGTYGCTINGVGWQAQPGDLLVVRPGDLHADDSTGPLEIAAVQFAVEPPLAWPAAASRRLRWGRAQSEALINALLDDPADALAAETADARCRLLLAQLLRAAGATDATAAATADGADPDGAFRDQVHAWFAERLARPLDLAGLAASIGISRRTLSARCRAACGTSPARLLHDLRLAHARLLLGETGLAVKAVATRCGFANANHFTTAFRKRFGHPPRGTPP